jgi:hypothetical protein
MNRQAQAAGLAVFLLCSAVLVCGLGSKGKKTEAEQMPESEAIELNITGKADESSETAPQNRIVQVSGRVRLVGTGVFPELVISGETREWFIDKDEQHKLIEFQQSVVTVEGAETYTDLTFANGLPAGRRYALKNIRLVSVNQQQ